MAIGNHAYDLAPLFAGFRATLDRAPARRWPLRSHAYADAFYPSLAAELRDVQAAFQRARLTPAAAVAAGMVPRRVWRTLHHVALAVALDTGVDAARETLTWLLEIVGEGRDGDLYNRDGRNLRVGAGARLTPLAHARAASPALAHTVHRLAASAWSYCETLYFAFHGAGFEAHGLYPTRDGTALIRDAFDLRPGRLWPQGELAPVASIALVIEYDARVEVTFSDSGTVLHHTPVLWQRARRLLVSVDGAPLAHEELDALTGELASVARRRAEQIDRLPVACQAVQLVRILWYQFEPLQRLLGRPWEPSAELLDRVRAHRVDPHAHQREDQRRRLLAIG